MCLSKYFYNNSEQDSPSHIIEMGKHEFIIW